MTNPGLRAGATAWRSGHAAQLHQDPAQLHLSLSTAKIQVGRLLMKLGARDRARLVIAAYDTGLVSLP